MSTMGQDDAIIVEGVTKEFRRTHVKKQITTLKSELVRMLRGGRQRRVPGDAITALKNLSLRIPRGKTVGLVGRNGSGKSTLLKLITGIYKPTAGTIQVGGRISALLDLGAGFHPDFTGRENILINGIILGMTRAQIRARLDEIVAFSELGDFVDEPVRTYSSGMFMRLAFAVATHVDPEILIADEILAVGDEHFARKSMAKMNEFKQAGRTILMVTHDLGALERWCDLAAWIDGGAIRMFGEPSRVVPEYRQAMALAERTDHRALTMPGIALPELERPATSFDVRLKFLGDRPPTDLDSEDACAIRIHAGGIRPDDALRLRFQRTDGLELHGTAVPREAVAALAANRGVEVHLARLGLLAGDYVVRLELLSGDGAVATATESAFSVAAGGMEQGVVRLPLTWKVEAGTPGPSGG